MLLAIISSFNGNLQSDNPYSVVHTLYNMEGKRLLVYWPGALALLIKDLWLAQDFIFCAKDLNNLLTPVNFLQYNLIHF